MENSFEIESGDLNISVSVICFDCNDGFSDQWEGTDKHQGGVTIANPDADRNGWKYYIPKQCTLSELAAAYAKQGWDNPSAAAYRSLQNQLERDICASDYGFEVSVYLGGVKLIDGVSVGCGFDYSCLDDGDLIDEARRVWDEFGVTEEATEYAKIAAREIVNAAGVLTAFIN